MNLTKVLSKRYMSGTMSSSPAFPCFTFESLAEKKTLLRLPVDGNTALGFLATGHTVLCPDCLDKSGLVIFVYAVLILCTS